MCLIPKESTHKPPLLLCSVQVCCMLSDWRFHNNHFRAKSSIFYGDGALTLALPLCLCVVCVWFVCCKCVLCAVYVVCVSVCVFCCELCGCGVYMWCFCIMCVVWSSMSECCACLWLNLCDMCCVLVVCFMCFVCTWGMSVVKCELCGVMCECCVQQCVCISECTWKEHVFLSEKTKYVQSGMFSHVYECEEEHVFWLFMKVCALNTHWGCVCARPSVPHAQCGVCQCCVLCVQVWKGWSFVCVLWVLAWRAASA